MTAFVLVSGSWTGGWIWQELAARLRESGAEVHPATLTGMGDRRHLAGPGTDLETHVEDLVQLIDEVDAPQLVIVGHDYGIHPVLGAADRRPDRIARIVYLDAGMPQDGDAALQVADQAVRDLLLDAAEQENADWRIPAPAPDEWQRGGSVAGLSEEALARMTRLAAPQPRGTLTQPLRLSGATAGLPTTGVFCTVNGTSIAMVQALVGFGDPRLQSLTDPQVSFFDLDTGHWPMLSAPGELSAVLLAAAAGEGHRLSAAATERPAHLDPFLLDLPERPRERVGAVDLYRPDGDLPAPAIVFVHGGPVPAEMRPTPRDWPTFVGYARYVAGLGAVGVTVDHGLHDLHDYAEAAENVSAAVELVRADPRVDGDRIAIWYFSGGGPLSAEVLAAPPSWLRCVAATYPVLAPLPNWGMAADGRFVPATAVRSAGALPIVLTRVELERTDIDATIEKFLAAAKDAGADVEVVDVPGGHHGFETVDLTEEAREAVRHAVRSVLGHLRG
ncbi:alpha/beta hydrolase [Kitasatospora sp. NBC_00240]|uniref:alpha/beta fold hydrolase n=1 Tax=Kitasatospora sp. NBC_00240 TaxID=2903567 RepID=UPI00225AECB8|nr:alpha/beta fold hydrolase [Kitasatospora sp. NBC_00240]MCX5211971.1 alpha/beta hydrolase [Kitasatospora sp. NBC_00240]